MNIGWKLIAASLVALAISGSRWLIETSLAISVADAQGGIWLAFSLVMCSATFLISFVLCYSSLHYYGKGRRRFAHCLIVGLVIIGVYTAHAIYSLRLIGAALSDAENPECEPERLRNLVGYPTGFGYEIDNRIASNPNTPPDVLQELYNRPGQIGTKMCLAANPNTPIEILFELSRSGDRHIPSALARNAPPLLGRNAPPLLGHFS
jgi:hypothetical protein